jgi:hypothetical protein
MKDKTIYELYKSLNLNERIQAYLNAVKRQDVDELELIYKTMDTTKDKLQYVFRVRALRELALIYNAIFFKTVAEFLNSLLGYDISLREQSETEMERLRDVIKALQNIKSLQKAFKTFCDEIGYEKEDILGVFPLVREFPDEFFEELERIISEHKEKLGINEKELKGELEEKLYNEHLENFKGFWNTLTS